MREEAELQRDESSLGSDGFANEARSQPMAALDSSSSSIGPGRFLTTRAPIRQHVKMFKQVQAPPSHVKERAYPKQVAHQGDVERYGELKIRKDETIFAMYDKVEMRKAKVLVVANSDFVILPSPCFGLT